MSNTFLNKMTNPRETYTRGESRKKPFDLDYAEEERWDQGQLTKSHKIVGSQPRIGGENNRISKPKENG